VTERTRPSAETREAEQREAKMHASGEPTPTPDEERAAEAVELDPKVAEAYEEQLERGANQQGEGRIP
jgi:hypothetical protein